MQIGIIGSWDNDLPERIYDTAEQAGRLIAQQGDVVFTGGSTGVMEAAMKGAKSAGGITVGMIPTESAGEYKLLGSHIDICIRTGMGELGKLAPLIHSVDAVIAVAGGSGTLIEISMAYIEQKPIVIIPFKGFTTDRIRNYMTGESLDHRGYQKIHTAADALSAVGFIYDLLAGKTQTPPESKSSLPET
ncbi:MAG: TIGR00725 family protein [Desulfosalsimonas sp.]